MYDFTFFDNKACVSESDLFLFRDKQIAYLRVFSIDDILLSIEEPIGNFVLPGIRHDSDDFFDLKAFMIHQRRFAAQT